MTALAAQIRSILDNYADAIEGGNAYRGSGTAYKGIPGTSSFWQWAGTSITDAAGAGDDRVTVPAATAAKSVVDTWVRGDTPPIFLRCTSQVSGSGNVGAARRITSTAANGSDTDAIFTTSLPESVQTGDVFTVAEGFKRAPDNLDMSRESGLDRKFDRAFQILMPVSAGTRAPWYGNSVQQFESEMEIRLRVVKHARDRTSRDIANDTMALFRIILTRGDLRGGEINGVTVQQLSATESAPDVLVDDATKIVIADRYRLVYRINSTYL